MHIHLPQHRWRKHWDLYNIGKSKENLQNFILNLVQNGSVKFCRFSLTYFQFYLMQYMLLSHTDDLLCLQLHTVVSTYTVHASNTCWWLAVPTAAHSTRYGTYVLGLSNKIIVFSWKLCDTCRVWGHNKSDIMYYWRLQIQNKTGRGVLQYHHADTNFHKNSWIFKHIIKG
jgi:hypothetical protein